MKYLVSHYGSTIEYTLEGLLTPDDNTIGSGGIAESAQDAARASRGVHTRMLVMMVEKKLLTLEEAIQVSGNHYQKVEKIK